MKPAHPSSCARLRGKPVAPARRKALVGAAQWALGVTAALRSAGTTAAEPWPAATQAAIDAFTGGQPWREGLVQLQIEPLVENGNVVPVAVRVAPADLAQVASASAGTALSVRRLALFTERNPEPGVAVFELSPYTPRLEVAARMRLATSGRVLAMAQLSDGRCYGRAHEVMVTLAACIEE